MRWASSTSCLLVFDDLDAGIDQRLMNGFELAIGGRLGGVFEEGVDVLLGDVALLLTLVEQLLEAGDRGGERVCLERDFLGLWLDGAGGTRASAPRAPTACAAAAGR
jgi:hypothetical protein